MVILDRQGMVRLYHPGPLTRGARGTTSAAAGEGNRLTAQQRSVDARERRHDSCCHQPDSRRRMDCNPETRRADQGVSEHADLPYRQLGRTGERVSALVSAVGTWAQGKGRCTKTSIRIFRTPSIAIQLPRNRWDYNEGARRTGWASAPRRLSRRHDPKIGRPLEA